MHFAAFENKGSVDLLEFKIPKRHVVRRQMKSSGAGEKLRLVLLNVKVVMAHLFTSALTSILMRSPSAMMYLQRAR